MDANNDDTAVKTWRADWARLRRRDRDAFPDTLGPPGVFSDKPTDEAERRHCGHIVSANELGPRSRTVTSRLRMSCTAWETVPAAAELYNAIHHPQGTKDEQVLLLVWFHEAEMAEQLDAKLENAYTWRSLATALHRVRLTYGPGAQRVNRFARR